MKLLVLAVLLLTMSALGQEAVEEKLVDGARSTLGDVYDSGYYSGGPPPKGRGACPDVLYEAFLRIGVDLQDELDRDIIAGPRQYPNVRDRNIDYRWCPNLIVWFRKYAKELPKDGSWKPGDVVFWSLLDDGVADHVGIVSDKKRRGVPLVIHNFPPGCREDDALYSWTVVGHFRLHSTP